MPKTEPRNQHDPADELGFEDAIERLEGIVGRMETERVPLDQMLADYEEGTALLKLCRSRIEHARERVETINKGLSRGAPSPGDEETVDGGDDDTQLL